MSTGFETPAYKLLISDVGRAKNISEGEWDLQISSANVGCERSDMKTTLRVKLVWIQGIVVSMAGNCMSVKDDTGEAKIDNIKAVPGGDHTGINIGAYVGIIGQITEVNPIVAITAVKVMCLKDKPLLKKIWPDEVKTLHAYLINLLEPSSV